MATHLDWLPGTATALVSGGAAWVASWITLRRYRKDRSDLDTARQRSHLNGALSALSSAGGEWRQLYEEECRRNETLVRRLEELEIEHTKLELEAVDLRTRVKRG